jgi:hypothetical protein
VSEITSFGHRHVYPKAKVLEATLFLFDLIVCKEIIHWI